MVKASRTGGYKHVFAYLSITVFYRTVQKVHKVLDDLVTSSEVRTQAEMPE